MSGLQVRYCSSSSLRPHPRNPRTYSKDQIRRIADGILAFRFANSILEDADLYVLAGLARRVATIQIPIENWADSTQ